MLTKVDMDWFNAAWRRAVRTFAETFIAVIGANAVFDAVTWKNAALSAIFATILAILWALKGLPEAATHGTITVNTTDPAKDTYLFEVDDLASISSKSAVNLKIVKE